MSIIGERNAEILGSQLKLIGQDRSREIDVLPEVGNRDRVSMKTLSSAGQCITPVVDDVRRGGWDGCGSDRIQC